MGLPSDSNEWVLVECLELHVDEAVAARGSVICDWEGDRWVAQEGGDLNVEVV